VTAAVEGLTISVPMPDNIANTRVHWRTRQRLKTKYAALLGALQGMGLIPAPTIDGNGVDSSVNALRRSP
jgi:hypothetical protein